MNLKNQEDWNTYKSDFEDYLLYTNEKGIFLNEIFKVINENQVSTILDIGAGNGLLGISISKKVNEYLAIERSPIFVKELTTLGLKTLEAEFPINIDKKFDMVLVCHSLSYRTGVTSFLKKAWELVKPQGILLLITFRTGTDINLQTAKDDWSNLMRAIGNIEEPNYKTVFKKIIGILTGFGNLEKTILDTTIKTPTLDSMLRSLTFFASK
jgi:2-polyprenyl-3-methyl-5-hydroxy-6-metoxy-1,4-benzoquinol methylase